MPMLSFAPVIPLPLWLALAISAAALLLWYARDLRRRAPGAWRLALTLMTLGIALPLLVLLNPLWLDRVPPPPGKPLATILIDTSSSMAIQDTDAKSTRIELARQSTPQLLDALQKQFDVRLRSFAEQSRLLSPAELSTLQVAGESTDMAAALEEAIREDRPQGQAVILLSDGIHTSGNSAIVLDVAARAKAMGVPIYTQTIGGAAQVRDLEIRLFWPQEVAFVEQKIPVRAQLLQRGLAGSTARVSLRHAGQVLAEREIALVDDQPAEATFEISQAKSGLFQYDLLVEPLAGELTPANNSAVLVLRVVDEPIRVLLLEGKPYWDTKFLIRTLAADPSIELTSVVRMAEGRLLERTMDRGGASTDGAPSAGSEAWQIRTETGPYLGDGALLSGFQIVVLGRDAEQFLDDAALANLRRWLSRDGGSLVCYRGSPASQIGQALGQFLPVRWSPGRESRFRVQWTDQGKALRWLSAEDASTTDPLTALPSLSSVAQANGPKPLAIVLAAAHADNAETGQPVISYQPFGSGRSVVVEGAGMWRWAFLAPAHQGHEAVYGTLWHSLVRWLVSQAGLLPAQQQLLRADKTSFLTHESATATLLTRQPIDTTSRVRLSRIENGSERPVGEFAPIQSGDEPGAYRVAFDRLPEGRYRAEIAGADAADPAGKTAFDVRPDLRERLDLTARPDFMARIARESEGLVLANNSPAEFLRAFEMHRGRQQPDQVRRYTAWDRWWLLAGTIGLWAICWSVRRASGLV